MLSKRTFFIVLTATVILAFAIRVGLAVKFVGLDSPPDFSANPDQIDYELFAYRVSIGAGYTFEDGTPTARRSPGTSWSLLPVYAVAGRSFAAARLWFCLLSAATCLAVAWIGSQLAGRGAGLLAAGLLAVYPGHAYYAMHFVSEVPYGLCLALGVAATIRALRGASGRFSVLAGVCFGFGILCRTQLTLLVPVALATLALLFPRTERGAWMGHARRVALQSVVVAAVLAPWLIRNHAVFGKPVLTNIAGLGVWGAHNPITFNDPDARGTWLRTSELEQRFGKLPDGEVLKDEEAKRRGMASIAVNLPRLPQIVAYKLGRFVWPFMDTPNQIVFWAFGLAWIAVMPLIFIGVRWTWRTASQGTLILLLPIASTVATVMLFYGSVRFRDSIAPLFITLAGVGAARVLAAMVARFAGRESETARTFQMPAKRPTRNAA